jgi:hypothetical protein
MSPLLDEHAFTSAPANNLSGHFTKIGVIHGNSIACSDIEKPFFNIPLVNFYNLWINVSRESV